MLYHYTDFSAFDGIIRCAELRLNNILNMNDASEMRLFMNGICKAVIEKLEADGEYTFRAANEMGGLGAPFVYTSTAGVEQVKAQPVNASVSNGRLTLDGLMTGTVVELYTPTGALLHKGVAAGSIVALPLSTGLNVVRIIRNGAVQVLKVLNK